MNEPEEQTDSPEPLMPSAARSGASFGFSLIKADTGEEVAHHKTEEEPKPNE
jgi:hypothetical protein